MLGALANLIRVPRPRWTSVSASSNSKATRSFVPLVLLVVLHVLQGVAAQTVNGQYFTNGLSVVNSPLPNQQFNAGGNLPISIEVTGDGKIPLTASVPSESGNLATAFNSLTLFLTSGSPLLTNITIVSNNTLLANEQGSSVKHFTWAIPSCIAKGNYNFTLYEQSKINNEEHFIITPIPITILSSTTSDATADSCPELAGAFNTFDTTQPQASTPLASSPFLDSNTTITTSASSAATPVAALMETLTLTGGLITTVTLVYVLSLGAL